MKFKIFCILFSLIATIVLSGCFAEAYEDDSKLPWAQPANWEGQIPGMRAMGGGISS